MSDELKQCPACKSPFGYASGGELFSCPECGNDWNPNDFSEEGGLKVLDSLGNELVDGDSVIIIKDLPVKGAPRPLKKGTKVKNISLTEGDHNINCRIDGFGAMGLKSEFVRKTS